MKPPAPPRVSDSYLFWVTSPPELSARCAWWTRRIRGGWRPGRRLRELGYDTSARYYGVYVWEYLNVISPLLLRLLPVA
jgi:hypothetical protein